MTVFSYLFRIIVAFCLYSTALAQSTVNTSLNAQQMLVNFAKTVPSLMYMVTAIAYVLGMYFIVAGIMKLKQLGESRTMMSSEHNIKGPIIYIVIGALLLYIPSSVQVGLSTFWSNPNPYGYTQQQDQWSDFLSNVFLVIQLIGVIAFIRGLVILSHLGSTHGQQGTFGRGVTHIIGGIFLINMYQFVQMVFTTLGITVS